MRHLAAVFALIPLVFGIFLMKEAIEAERDARASLDWPSVPGVIVNRNLTSMKGRKDLDVDYTYVVDGVAHKGRRVAFAANAADYPAWAKRFAPKTSVPVYYDPARPSMAVLVPGGDSVARGVFWAGCCFVAFAAWLFWNHFRKSARPLT
ncbi:MAG: hypothetical protein RLZZ50_675 [Verrucomicrobiota bacterium]